METKGPPASGPILNRLVWGPRPKSSLPGGTPNATYSANPMVLLRTVLQRTKSENRGVWSVYRWWFCASPLPGPAIHVLFGGARAMHVLSALQDAALSSLVIFIGTWI